MDILRLSWQQTLIFIEHYNLLASTLCCSFLLTVLGNIYELLGVLGEVHPSEMVNNSDKLYKAYLGELKVQVKKLKALNKL